MLSAIKLDRKEVYVTNVVPWRPPQNRTPTDEEILDFLPFLQRQIEIIKPTFIYLLGTTAAKAILSTPLSLGKLRGQWHEYKTINMKQSFYCGDGAGRKADHTNDDLLFSINTSLNFLTPEMLFEDKPLNF